VVPAEPPTRYVVKLGVEIPNVLVSIRMTAVRGQAGGSTQVLGRQLERDSATAGRARQSSTGVSTVGCSWDKAGSHGRAPLPSAHAGGMPRVSQQRL
jgi:hypothetical protein